VYSYSYNGLDQRVRKSGPASVIATGSNDYIYDEAGQLLGEYDSGRAILQETVYLDNLPVAVLKRDTSAQIVVSYVYSDHINTPRVIARASDNKIVWRWDQADPFGASPAIENPSANGVFVYHPRFPGQLYDRETGLHYNYFRDYDPQTGRYVESDPIGLKGGINTYSYVGANPVSLVDPSGLAATGAAIGGAIGGWVGGALTVETGPGMAFGILAGRIFGRAAGSAIEDACRSGPDCDELNRRVQNAKDAVGKLGACKVGMSRYDLRLRYGAWLALAEARSKRDQVCWAGGDEGHQQAQADAWHHVGKCGNML
jgi:RHS repeat-associated protein